jgi:hypothetical protein
VAHTLTKKSRSQLIILGIVVKNVVAAAPSVQDSGATALHTFRGLSYKQRDIPTASSVPPQVFVSFFIS